eukprot:SAG11_NODE_6826_length_1239_cov_1.293860_1_plen_293_part_10
MVVALLGCLVLLCSGDSAKATVTADSRQLGGHADAADAVAQTVATVAESDANTRIDSGPRTWFKAVWNCPYLGNDVVDKFGITANPSGGFNGSVMVLFYGPQTWPSLAATQNPAMPPCWSGKKPCTWNQSLIWQNMTVKTNGGVPQAGDIELHKAAVAALVEEMIPDPDWSGYGIFDWEEWRALYSENDDSLSYHNYYSTLLVRQQHPDWINETKISEEAERQYNAGSQLFFTETLRTAKKLRPKGKFGFYEYPMSASTELTWLWSEVGVMAGSQCANCFLLACSCCLICIFS